MKRNALVALVERTNSGYSAYYPDIDDAIATTGQTISELKENLANATVLYIEEMKTRGQDVSHLEGKEVEIKLDVKQFFEFFPSLNVSGFSKYTGINRSLLAQYVRGLRVPSETQSLRILEGIHKLGRDYQAIQF